MQAQPGDDAAKAALVQQLDENLQEEQRTWCRQDREFLQLLTPLQVQFQKKPPKKWKVGSKSGLQFQTRKHRAVLCLATPCCRCGLVMNGHILPDGDRR